MCSQPSEIPGKRFSAEDALSFAIRIEENGEAFYREAGRAASGEAKRLLEELAAEEAKHRVVFEKMLATLGTEPPEESYPGEYLAHLQYYVDGKAVFLSTAADSGIAGGGDARAVLDFAIQRELDTVLYFQELRPVLPPAQLEVLDAILAEERDHFTQLSRAASAA